ncbi:MAG: hypothetical protein WCG28_04645 [bacterium]
MPTLRKTGEYIMSNNEKKSFSEISSDFNKLKELLDKKTPEKII